MNEVLKQRLVGALILLALGVIFWPIIFVQPDNSDLEQQRTIPPQPDVSTAPMDAPDKVGLRPSPARPPEPEPEPLPEPEPEPLPEPQDSAQAAADAVRDKESMAPPGGEAAGSAPDVAVPTASRDSAAEAPPALPRDSTRSESPEPLAMDAQGVPVAWILQVASVSSAEKAESLRQSLLEVDQRAYVTRVSSGGRDLYRVYIGPKFEKDKLEQMRGQIDAQFGVTSMIRRYVP